MREKSPKTEPFEHYERPKNCAMLSLASEWTKLLEGEIKVSHSPDFLPLRPPLLEGVLLLVRPLHPGHLVLRPSSGTRSTLVRLICGTVDDSL